MENELKLISEQSKQYHKVQNLMKYVNKTNLLEEHKHMNPKKAIGVDGITKEMYEKNLEENIDILLEKMKRFQYRPKPTRKVEI